MSNYIGVRCPVCNKKFTEADDIVVCPVCGAPHHRDCYTATNRCAFAEDHLSGKEWTDPAGQTPPNESEPGADEKKCPQCGATNPSDSIFCRSCGNPLSIHPSGTGGESPAQNWVFPGFQMSVDTISMAYGGLSPDEEIEGETVRDIAQYVGSGSAYYLPRFRLISGHKRMITFNISALIFSFLYFFYRKMYLIGGFLLVLSIISNIPTYLYTWETLPQFIHAAGLGPPAELNYAVLDHLYNLSRLTRAINGIICLVASLFANRYYFTRTIASVSHIRQESARQGDTPQQYSQKLARSGGCNRKLVIALLVVYLVAIMTASCMLVYTQALYL